MPPQHPGASHLIGGMTPKMIQGLGKWRAWVKRALTSSQATLSPSVFSHRPEREKVANHSGFLVANDRTQSGELKQKRLKVLLRVSMRAWSQAWQLWQGRAAVKRHNCCPECGPGATPGKTDAGLTLRYCYLWQLGTSARLHPRQTGWGSIPKSRLWGCIWLVDIRSHVWALTAKEAGKVHFGFLLYQMRRVKRLRTS